MKPKVILGMSGGVDSSVAALLLQKQGYEVIGFFMNASPSGKPPWPSTISWKDEESTLKKICDKLKIRLIVKNCEQSYEKNVIQPMFKDYSCGLTPNPDIFCNNVGKFPSLLKIAKQEHADYIATGHYARVRRSRKGFELLRGKDKEKDQSYFLIGLNQKTLSKTLFPLGDFTKTQVREIAKKADFPNFDKRSSRGICYLGKIDMKAFLKQRIKLKQGNILSPEREVIGSHPGTMFFTIGERIRENKGLVLNKSFKKPFSQKKFYIAKKTKNNGLVIAPESHPLLKTKSVKIKKFKLINKKDFPKSGLTARIRHLGQLIPGKFAKNQFIFSKPQEGVAEGQFIALYQKEKLIGGGEIRLY
ncbi:MAG: tRNA 2-thiouridine(34) synthase MnmA [Nanoarchaeota archaeon]|nr:tRNA 2-thiouridine(34) synthase MnmA [Nanoarchaeota archaeon]MBU0977242.1 tRNA 2-thiouridine(34) synthase MnmA [Nanoarchaeota archaeon]